LEDAAFFEEAKFPQMKFGVKNLSLTEEGYLAEGEFTMKGKTKKVPVVFQFVGKGERDGKSFIVLKGSGKLNRTDFGMTPDPGIGDVVNFEFQTEFVAK
jgi:polyisoprenoid-binding protein YceI